MTKLSTTPFDAAKFLTEPEDILELLNDALESGDPRYIAVALGTMARSEGMSKIAARTGINRQALYTALGENGNPTLETLLKVISALGLKLKLDRAEAA